jgi:hypothetical protein
MLQQQIVWQTWGRISLNARIRMFVEQSVIDRSLVICKGEWNLVPCLSLVQSASSFHTGNITWTYYKRVVTGCEVISCWQQSIVAHAPSFSVMLPCWHDMVKRTLQTCTLLNDVNSCVARSKVGYVAITVREDRQRPSSGDGLIAVCALQEKYNTHVTWGCIIQLCVTF